MKTEGYLPFRIWGSCDCEGLWNNAELLSLQSRRQLTENYRVHYSPSQIHILCQIYSVHIFPPYLTSTILYCHLRWGLPRGLFPSFFPTKTCTDYIRCARFDTIRYCNHTNTCLLPSNNVVWATRFRFNYQPKLQYLWQNLNYKFKQFS